jgi:hypothetical protein
MGDIHAVRDTDTERMPDGGSETTSGHPRGKPPAPTGPNNVLGVYILQAMGDMGLGESASGHDGGGEQSDGAEDRPEDTDPEA